MLRRAAKRLQAPLREFVYLDDVSVYSLLASRVGPVATDFTDSQTASLQSDLTASAGAGVAGLAKADVSSRLQAAQTQGSQVLRKAIVQTTFKELYELENSRLIMRPVETEERPPKLRGLGELVSRREELHPWVVDVEALPRGGMVEIEVELSAEPIFRMSTVISALVEMMQENEELARAAASTGELDQVAAMSRIIERLLVGLIPVRGRAVDFDVVAANGHEWIVHRQVTKERREELIGAARFPLYVVGVAQEGLFWKDIRRVLFSKSRYRALCRVSRPGVQTSWTPVKLIEVLADVAPGLAATLGAATDSVLMTVAEAPMAADAPDDPPSESTEEAVMRAALLDYATLLAASYGCTVSNEDMLEAGLLTRTQCVSHETVESRRVAFHEITSFVAQRCGVDVEAEVAAQCRSTVWLERHLSPNTVEATSMVAEASSASFSEARYLDVEFVAMYW
jgi:hypothetical protein